MIPPHTTTTCVQTCERIVFVPVEGRTVFFTCLFLIVVNLVWLALWLTKGVRFEEDA